MMILFWLVWAVSMGVVVFVVGKCLWDFFKWLMPSLRAWWRRRKNSSAFKKYMSERRGVGKK